MKLNTITHTDGFMKTAQDDFVKTQTFLIHADPVLGKIIHQVPKPEIVSTQAVFHDLMSCIIEQQIHYRSTKRIVQNLLNKAGIEMLSPQNFDLFEQKALQHIKISMNKVETIGRILSFWENNTPDWQNLSDEEVRGLLSSIKGIGPWTIDMILLYTLQRKNIFPVDDFHLKRIMVSLYGLDEKTKLKAQMLQIAENWGEYKSTAVLYLLEWKKQSKS